MTGVKENPAISLAKIAPSKPEGMYKNLRQGKHGGDNSKVSVGSKVSAGSLVYARSLSTNSRASRPCQICLPTPCNSRMLVAPLAPEGT